MKESSLARRFSLKRLIVPALAASALLASGQLSAAPVITGLVLQDQSAGTLEAFSFNNLNHTIDINKTFEVDPPSMKIWLTVGSGASGSGSYSVSETINNKSGVDWVDYHVALQNAPSGTGFGNVSSSTMSGFTLDASSDASKLNFTGALANGSSAAAKFMLNLMDPGKGNSYKIALVQTPSVVPVPMAGWLFGSGLFALGGFVRRKIA